jgi:hypothetical protein
MEFLKKASRHENCDFITRDKRELERYAFDCGILLALMTCTGMIDNHCENLVLHKRRPMLIDCEVFLAFFSAAVGSTDCLEGDFGSMSKYSMVKQVYSCLFDINGEIAKALDSLEKNRIFHLYLLQGEKLIAYHPDKDILLQGYRAGLKILTQSNMALNWINQQPVQQMCMRVLTSGTNEFRKQMELAYQNDFDQIAFEKRRTSNFSLEKKAFERELTSYQGIHIAGVEILYKIPPLPHYFRYANSDPNSNLLSEYRSGNIPVFYAVANDVRLYDFNGRAVRAPIGNRDEEYFPRTPIDFIKSRILCIIDEESAIPSLIEKADREYSRNLEQEPKDAIERLIVIDLLESAQSEVEKVGHEKDKKEKFSEDSHQPKDDRDKCSLS